MENRNPNSEEILNRFVSGYHQYILQEPVRLSRVSENLCELTGYTEEELLHPGWDMYAMMVHPGDREAYFKFLNKVSAKEQTLTSEYRLVRKDGAVLWVRDTFVSGRSGDGTRIGSSVLTDMTGYHREKEQEEISRYLNVLSSVYDKIFELNRSDRMIKCLHCEPGSSFRMLQGISMRRDELLEKWMKDSVDPKYWDELRAFFNRDESAEAPDRPEQITYEAVAADGILHAYSGIFIKADESVTFFCCRRKQDHDPADTQKTESDRLREGIRDLVMRFSDGIAAFEVAPDRGVKPLYASENVCEFFGYSQEEWMGMAEHFTSLERFVSGSEASPEDFSKLLEKGEAEFTYFDYKAEKARSITAICSQKEEDPTASRFVMLYKKAEESGTDAAERKIFVRTFGYFDVFVDEQPIPFRNKKSKELLALLVDRRGGYVTSEEAIGYLWEEEPVNALTLSRYRKTALRLKNTLEEYGIADMIENVDGKRRIVHERVRCDLYEFLAGSEEGERLFRGSYMTNYSWGENTLGELMNEKAEL